MKSLLVTQSDQISSNTCEFVIKGDYRNMLLYRFKDSIEFWFKTSVKKESQWRQKSYQFFLFVISETVLYINVCSGLKSNPRPPEQIARVASHSSIEPFRILKIHSGSSPNHRHCINLQFLPTYGLIHSRKWWSLGKYLVKFSILG